MNVLKQDALSIPFSTIDWIKISNIGFVDGELHIQTTLEDDCFNNLMSLSFVDENNNKVYDSLFSVGYGRSSVDLNTGLARYYEFVFEDINNLSQVKDLRLSLDIAEYGQYFEGNWEAKFKVPAEAKKIEIPVSNKLKISGEEITVDKMTLSPLEVSIYYKSNNTDTQNNDDVLYVTYKDGSVINLTFLSKGTDNNNNVTYEFSGEVIKIEDVKSININGIELLVE